MKRKVNRNVDRPLTAKKLDIMFKAKETVDIRKNERKRKIENELRNLV